jgi:hypothetical protein
MIGLSIAALFVAVVLGLWWGLHLLSRHHDRHSADDQQDAG